MYCACRGGWGVPPEKGTPPIEREVALLASLSNFSNKKYKINSKE